MPRQTQTPTREAEPLVAPAEIVQPGEPGGGSGDFRVLLYDDDWHPIDEVVEQLIKATGYDLEKCVLITLEVHQQGRAICYRGGRAECQRVARVLREIRLQCEVDCD